MVAIAYKLNLDIAKCFEKIFLHNKTYRVAVVHNVRILQLIQSQTE